MKAQASSLRDRIRSVPARFRQQYKEGDRYWDRPLASGHRARDIAAALDALDVETCSEADVDAAMGANGTGPGWCRVRCDGCGTYPDGTVVFVGDEPDYESNSATLCEACVRDALAVIVEVSP